MSSAAAPRVRVIVVNHNSGPWLARCLAALQRQTWCDFEAVVVDNASSDGSMCLPLDDPRFFAIRQHLNLGFAAASNLGAQGARGAWLALLNPDTEAQPDWLAQLLFAASAHPNYAIFGSTQLRAENRQVLDGRGDCLSAYGAVWRSGYGHRRPRTLPSGEVFSACAAALLIERIWFERLGGFEDRFFCYVEDIDLCFRARLLGARVWQCAPAEVLHAGSFSGGGSFSTYHGTRNLAWMLMRCMPGPLLPLALTGYVLSAILMLLRSRGVQARGARWRGLVDGLGGWERMRPTRQIIQASRRYGVFQVAAWLSWNPLAPLLRRAVDLTAAASRREPFILGD